jgi:hypothetical protein
VNGDQIVDDRLLMTIHPAGQGDAEKPQGTEEGTHGARLARSTGYDNPARSTFCTLRAARRVHAISILGELPYPFQPKPSVAAGDEYCLHLRHLLKKVWSLVLRAAHSRADGRYLHLLGWVRFEHGLLNSKIPKLSVQPQVVIME